jgi:LysM repeat protein
LRKLLFSAALGGIAIFAAPVTASAHPVDLDGYQVQRTVAPASDPPPKVTARVVRAPQPLPRVTVRSGDNLSGLGARTHRTWAQLASYNHIPNPNLIYVGQVITVPSASYVAGPVSLPVAAPAYTPPVHAYSAPPVVTYTPRAAPVARTYQGYSGGGGGGSFTGIWACIAQHESGGNAATNTGNGFYGGLQFTLGTWQANGGSGNPANASAAEQQRVAQNVVAASGGSYGAWPVTSGMCGV